MEKVTPYELATLASKICPDLCMKNPTEAIEIVERLLSAARMALWQWEQNERENEDLNRYEAETAWIGRAA
jgi:cobalamin biosynthesis Mg chelatase CobN